MSKSSFKYAGHTDRAAMLILARHDASATVIRTSPRELAVPGRKLVFRVAAETMFPAGIIVNDEISGPLRSP